MKNEFSQSDVNTYQNDEVGVESFDYFRQTVGRCLKINVYVHVIVLINTTYRGIKSKRIMVMYTLKIMWTCLCPNFLTATAVRIKNRARKAMGCSNIICTFWGKLHHQWHKENIFAIIFIIIICKNSDEKSAFMFEKVEDLQ